MLKNKISYLLHEQRNFNVLSRKDITYDNIKSHKKPGLHPKKLFLEKPEQGLKSFVNRGLG